MKWRRQEPPLPNCLVWGARSGPFSFVIMFDSKYLERGYTASWKVDQGGGKLGPTNHLATQFFKLDDAKEACRQMRLSLKN